MSQLGKSLGPKYGVQIWDAILEPKFWAHLAMLFWLLVCARRLQSPNSYALPREEAAQAVAATSASWINQTDQTSSQPCFATSTEQLQPVEGLRAEARKAWFFRPRKVGPQFQLRLPREADLPSAPVLCSQTTAGGAPLVVNIWHLANMATLIYCLIP